MDSGREHAVRLAASEWPALAQGVGNGIGGSPGSPGSPDGDREVLPVAADEGHTRLRGHGVGRHVAIGDVAESDVGTSAVVTEGVASDRAADFACKGAELDFCHGGDSLSAGTVPRVYARFSLYRRS